MDWLQILDLQQAFANLRTEIAGDWYRDPWSWCELEWLVPKQLSDYALPRLNAEGVKSAYKLDVPKENFAVRPAVVLDPLDRLLYQALVDRLSTKLVGDLEPWAYGWRLRRKKIKDGLYARNDHEWEMFRRHLKMLTVFHEAALTTDVVSFFASIPGEPLIEQILERGQNKPAERVVDMVAAWYVKTGRGLPQRSTASAVLAHMYLRPVDDVLRQANKLTRRSKLVRQFLPRGRSLRWMDDIWVFGRDQLALREIQLATQAAMRTVGLEMNVGKTAILEGDALNEAAFQIEHSAADQGLERDEPDAEALNQLVERLLVEPAIAPRTSIRFATTRMRKWSLFENAPALADRAAEMPHAADYLSRLFHSAETWRDMQDWYQGYAKKWKARLPWSVAQFGTMFPSTATVSESVLATFTKALEQPGTALPFLSVAAQRLSIWSPGDARVLCRDAVSTEADPFKRRSLALASLHAGETKTVVRKMLREHEENMLVLAMLEDRGFKPKSAPASPDFG